MRCIMFAAGTFAAAFLSLSVQRAMGASYWTFYAIAAPLAVICCAVSAALIGAYIERGTGSFDIEEDIRGMQNWELTAGTGVVPRWVSWIGLASVCFALAITFEAGTWLFRSWR